MFQFTIRVRLGLNRWWYLVICSGTYTIKFTFNRIETNWRFLCRAKLRNDKQLINCSYNPHKKMRGNHLQALRENADSYSFTYDKFIILGDFNVEMGELCDIYSLRSLIKQQTCYKSPTNPSGVDLILTCRPQSFHCTCVLETGLSEFH